MFLPLLLLSLISSQELCTPPPYQDAFIFTDKNYAVRYYSNINITQTSNTLNKVKKLIIVIHGAARDADNYYSAMCGAAQIEGYNVTNNDIIIVAPRFMESSDNPKSNELYWHSSWRGGGNSVVPNTVSLQVSSYTVSDNIIKLLFIDNNNLYPNLQNVSIVGHSAGGQYVMRYSLVSSFELNKNKGYFMKYVPANPSSFAYLDSRRWFNDEIYRELTDIEKQNCPGYNQWEYGWDQTSTFPPYILSQNMSLNEFKQQFINRNVTFLHGTSDVCNHNDNSSCTDHDMDTSCNAMYQGEYRLERGIGFLRSLQEIYGTFQHRIDFVPFVGHDHVDMFQHPNGRRAIF